MFHFKLIFYAHILTPNIFSQYFNFVNERVDKFNSFHPRRLIETISAHFLIKTIFDNYTPASAKFGFLHRTQLEIEV